ncbi:class I SAM-dependent methyltransferase [Pleomorphomonas sp. JP5]|uniref:class I SAM-dependent methyltransferase n=1 Tax=Pleomorphomonas sp. JP5 TaxID=2942998 RepID=UPI0020433BFE|nr:class I SAM-dependent methyltransferase [Pleomorphomonas sp. JP5]MCM5557654.1 class I SAM-dependent methyltransferase [Pleomorphomonas sp. JP5]
MSHHCRFCSAPLSLPLVDLGTTPLANSNLRSRDDITGERSFPLAVMVCESCFLAQTTENVPADAIFHDDYAYFSSFSPSWVEHARRYAEAMIGRFSLGKDSLVVEVASNDGYLLQHFVGAGIPVLGIEPAGNCAREAEERGVPTLIDFFGKATAVRVAKGKGQADLAAANNVLAHVPDISDFIAGFKALLKPKGVVTFEFPHLLNLIALTQFDTIYHEHYSYLSLTSVERILARHGLVVFDVEQLPTHGGSLRVFAGHAEAGWGEEPGLLTVRAAEAEAHLGDPTGYRGFTAKVEKVRDDFLRFLAKTKTEGKTVAGYGAAAKGNTFMNYCRLSESDIAFVADRNPHKQGRLLPGVHAPIADPDLIGQTKPDYVLILPWNLSSEIEQQLGFIRDWGGQFVTAIPSIRIF